MVGKNTIAGDKAMAYVHRIEANNKQIKTLKDRNANELAQAKAEGLNPKGLRHMVKIRKMKPHEFEEAREIATLYEHAAGMANELPLFRQIGALAKDGLAKDKLIDAFKLLVPHKGSITIDMEGRPIRLFRDKDGKAHAEEVEPPKPQSAAPSYAAPEPENLPDCTAEEAEQMGAQAYSDNRPITSNPFPFGDKRQARWDKGWRNASGGDGMGPGA